MALTTSNAPPGAGPAPPGPHTRRRRPLLGTQRRQVMAGLIIAGALAFLLLEGLSNATVYFKTADQAVADRAALGSRPFRIEGTVEPGVRQVGGVTSFSIVANGVRVQVVNSRQPPELFKPGIPVVLEGHWRGQVYVSDQIMVKHTASYVEAHPDRLKSQLPGGSPGSSGSSGSTGSTGSGDSTGSRGSRAAPAAAEPVASARSIPAEIAS